MQRLATGMRSKQGFTLIELLIVLIIIGITFGFALIAFGDFGESRRLLFAAEHLANTLKLGQQQAILESATLGLRIDRHAYQLLKWSHSAWVPVSSHKLFKLHKLPEHTILLLQSKAKVSPGSPGIIITPRGNFSPFILNFYLEHSQNKYILQGTQKGSLNLKAESE